MEWGGDLCILLRSVHFILGDTRGPLDCFKQGNDVVMFAFQNACSGYRRRIGGGHTEDRQTSKEGVAVV